MNNSNLCIEEFPNEKDSRFNWTILRAPPDRSLPLIVLARQCFGIRTHFWNNRTGPHYKTGCAACAGGRKPRWTGYLPCINPADGSQTLLEYTPPAAEQLQKIIRTQGFLRGSQIVAGRAKKVPNGKVTIVSRGIYEHLSRLPEEPNVLPILFHIWGLKQNDETQNGTYDRDSLPLAETPGGNNHPGAEIAPGLEAIIRASIRDIPGQKTLPLDRES